MTMEDIEALAAGPLFGFADWPNPAVPNKKAGVYTIWDGDELVYVGMAGRGMRVDDQRADAAGESSRPRGLRGRLGSHASGRRSGDQFCIDVFDRLVLPALSGAQIAAAGSGELSLDEETRRYIRDRLSYRFAVTDDARSTRVLERRVQREGLRGRRLLLNP